MFLENEPECKFKAHNLSYKQFVPLNILILFGENKSLKVYKIKSALPNC